MIKFLIQLLFYDALLERDHECFGLLLLLRMSEHSYSPLWDVVNEPVLGFVEVPINPLHPSMLLFEGLNGVW